AQIAKDYFSRLPVVFDQVTLGESVIGPVELGQIGHSYFTATDGQLPIRLALPLRWHGCNLLWLGRRHRHNLCSRFRNFAMNLRRLFVFAQPHEHRKPHVAVIGPSGERYFANETRLDPVRRSVALRLLLEWAGGAA